MSLVELREVKGEGGAVSGGAMDRVIERKRIDKRILIGAGAAAIVLLLLFFWLFAPRSGSQTVNPERLTISQVQQGVFDDFLPLRARVAPLVTVYLDAVEGGRVEQLAVEDGATVVKGQLLAILSNADLQLSTLARQTEVEQQLNNMRSQELALQQTRSANRRELNQVQTDLSKAQRLYDLQRPLADKGFVSGKAFNDTKDDLSFQRNRLAILKRSIGEDEALQASQLGQLRASTTSLNQSLSIARSSLSQLSLRAPV
jgi:HlyD family secretion protein